MSRVAKQPVAIPKGVDIKLEPNDIKVKGPKGNLSLIPHHSVKIVIEKPLQEKGAEEAEEILQVASRHNSKESKALAGTFRAIINNMVLGVTQGFEKQLNLVGVGFRAQVQGKNINLSLGFSHPVIYAIPDGINVETPDNTTIRVKGIDKQLVGQVAAEIRAFRPPEPYKGKGILYAGEVIERKETKK